MTDTDDTTGPAEAQAAEEQGVDTPGAPLAEPSATQATRARMQGGGVGQREINAQRDPTRTRSTDQLSPTDDAGAE